MKTKMNNKGFSLVELVIIIAIMAILIGVMAANISRISGYRAKECRTKVISSLDNGRLMTLSKSRGGSYVGNTETYLVFFKYNANGCNYCMTVIQDEITDVKKISKGNVTLKYATTQDATDGTAVPTLGDASGPKEISIDSDAAVLDTLKSGGFKVAFSRQNGSFLPLDEGKTQYVYHMFSLAGIYNYEITLHPKTGKVETGDRTRVPTS